MGKRMGGKNESGTSPVWFIAIVLGIVLIAALFILDRRSTAKANDDLETVRYEYEQEQLAKEEAEAEAEAEAYAAYIEEIETTYSFYQKLAIGYDVNVLIIGDSTGAGIGVDSSDGENHIWYDLLLGYLQETYIYSDETEFEGNISFTNTSTERATSYAAYVNLMRNEDENDYDLVIICCGEEDDGEDFSVHYEALLRAVREKYPDSSMLAVLESSMIQEMEAFEDEEAEVSYTEKMLALQELCEYYDVPVADTVDAYLNSGYEYDELSDGDYPNEDGQEIYYETVRDVIVENVDAGTGLPDEMPDKYDEAVSVFDNFVWYDVSDAGGSDSGADFVQTDEVTYTLEVTDTGMLGIDYTFQSAEDAESIFGDGETYNAPTVDEDEDFPQDVVWVLMDEVTGGTQIQIVFESETQAEGFAGICLNWE